MEITEGVREWDYGDYEGLTSKQIRESRREKGRCRGIFGSRGVRVESTFLFSPSLQIDFGKLSMLVLMMMG